MASFRKLLEDVCLDDKGTVLEYFEDFIKVAIAIKIKNEYYSESDEVSLLSGELNEYLHCVDEKCD